VRRADCVNCSRDPEARLHERLSWEEAQEVAGKWLGELRLGRNLDGKTVDLTMHGPSLKAEGVFREMVLNAAYRKLRKRGAREILLPL